VTTKLPTRLMILSNELPKIYDPSGALANRMIILRLTRSFLGKEDPKLTDKQATVLPALVVPYTAMVYAQLVPILPQRRSAG
jgi:putative DNA primase/helicase